MRAIFCKTCIIAFLFYLPFSANAWGVNGHRIVGEIADSYLSANARKSIVKILGSESIAMASNYADFIKSDSLYAYVSPWHYVNIPESLSQPEVMNFLDSDTSVDAYTKLNFIVKQLRNKNSTVVDKVFYLKLLIHIVGDIHQPLHTGHAADQDGNTIKVFWFQESTNLHRLWDDQLIVFQQLSYTEYAKAINHPTATEVNNWQKFTLKQWLYDSYKTAENIYALTKPGEHLSYKYNYMFVQTLNTQLLNGGIHLAALLNDIYG